MREYVRAGFILFQISVENVVAMTNGRSRIVDTKPTATILIVPLWEFRAGLSHPRYVRGDLIRGHGGNEDQLE